jgi:serine/threonine-protein kinase SRPK3
MIALLGPIPPELIERERDMRHWRWDPGIFNAKGEICDNAMDFYGGPFFDSEGMLDESTLVDLTQD